MSELIWVHIIICFLKSTVTVMFLNGLFNFKYEKSKLINSISIVLMTIVLWIFNDLLVCSIIVGITTMCYCRLFTKGKVWFHEIAAITVIGVNLLTRFISLALCRIVCRVSVYTPVLQGGLVAVNEVLWLNLYIFVLWIIWFALKKQYKKQKIERNFAVFSEVLMLAVGIITVKECVKAAYANGYSWSMLAMEIKRKMQLLRVNLQ